MDIITALILGIVQGLAEYLPISSSGHLEIFRQILGLRLDGAESLEFDIILHAATVLSTIVVLWKELRPMITSFFTWRRDSDFFYVCRILVSCIPILIVGLCFKDAIEAYLFGKGLSIVGWCLLATAALLTFSYCFRTRPLEHPRHGSGASYTPRDITYRDAFIIGCAQAVAILPGLSRSGSTIATGILLGDKREQVAKFSFLMVIIPILGEALLQVKDMLTATPTAGESTIGWAPLAIGFVASFITGCAACKWMLAIVRKGKLIWFALYCLAVGLLCILKNYGVF